MRTGRKWWSAGSSELEDDAFGRGGGRGLCWSGGCGGTGFTDDRGGHLPTPAGQSPQRQECFFYPSHLLFFFQPCILVFVDILHMRPMFVPVISAFSSFHVSQCNGQISSLHPGFLVYVMVALVAVLS